MASNATAVRKVAADLAIEPEAARALLVRLRISAKAVADEYGLKHVLRVAAARGN